MFKNWLTLTGERQQVEISPDPRPGVLAPSPADLNRWLEEDVEVIDLGEARRDQVIQPTTWHAACRAGRVPAPRPEPAAALAGF